MLKYRPLNLITVK